MSQQKSAVQLARAWIDGWNAGKPDEIPLAENFVHTSPFGVIEGRDEYLERIKPLAAKNVSDLRILKTLGAENDAAIWFEMWTPNGMVPVCDWVEVSNGEIVAITSFYDPSSLPHREEDTE